MMNAVPIRRFLFALLLTAPLVPIGCGGDTSTTAVDEKNKPGASYEEEIAKQKAEKAAARKK